MDICEIVEDEDIERDVLVLGAFASFMYPDVECLDLNYGALINKYTDFEWDSHAAVSGGNYKNPNFNYLFVKFNIYFSFKQRSPMVIPTLYRICMVQKFTTIIRKYR